MFRQLAAYGIGARPRGRSPSRRDGRASRKSEAFLLRQESFQAVVGVPAAPSPSQTRRLPCQSESQAKAPCSAKSLAGVNSQEEMWLGFRRRFLPGEKTEKSRSRNPDILEKPMKRPGRKTVIFQEESIHEKMLFKNNFSRRQAFLESWALSRSLCLIFIYLRPLAILANCT